MTRNPYRFDRQTRETASTEKVIFKAIPHPTNRVTCKARLMSQGWCQTKLTWWCEYYNASEDK